MHVLPNDERGETSCCRLRGLWLAGVYGV